jgi:hypothetical protein
MSSSSEPPERLEKRLARVAREQGVDQERLRRWVSFLALCGVLERAMQEGLLGRYYLKGGVAMELRFAQRARATKDLDLGIEGSRVSRLETLSNVLRLGFDQFTFRVKARTHDMALADTIRVEVAVLYRTRSWQTIEVDLGPATAGEIDLIDPHVHGLAELAIPVTSPVRCLALPDQVAQKLHACSGPAAAGRARDVLDILLIDLLGHLDYSKTAKAATRIFQERATHAFPPAFTMPAEWHSELEAMAAELNFPIKSSDEIGTRFREIIKTLEMASRSR